MKKLRSGKILFEVCNSNQASNIKNYTMFGNILVTISAHRSLNTSTDLISEIDLLHVSHAEILESLTDQTVIGALRINFRRKGKQIPAKHLVLNFNQRKLPDAIKARYLSCKRRPLIPNTLRCFNCQLNGHSKTSCREKQT